MQKQTAVLAGNVAGDATPQQSGNSAGATVAASSSSSSRAAGDSSGAGGASSRGSSSGSQQRLGPKGELPAADSIDEPKDFNWKAYLLRYPDLRAGNIRSKEAAAWHYTQKGHKEHRSYAKVPILLRYTACQGLFNQMYAHLNALVLAEYLGADVMLPPSVYRESFAKYFSMDLKKNEVKWTPTSTGALLDVDSIAAHYAQKGGRRRGCRHDGSVGAAGQVCEGAVLAATTACTTAGCARACGAARFDAALQCRATGRVVFSRAHCSRRCSFETHKHGY